MINLSIQTGIIPKNWKLARVTPIFKEGDRVDPLNYRPISVLPVLMKIIERGIHGQLLSYIEAHNILTAAQSGFRGSHSTVTATLELLDGIYRGMDMGLVTLIVYLDFKKAFDTVDHGLLIDKLTRFGVSPHGIKWFRAYFQDRTQVTVVNSVVSDAGGITCGVP